MIVNNKDNRSGLPASPSTVHKSLGNEGGSVIGMGQFVLSDGSEMAFDDVGAGRPLLFVHGFSAHGGYFAPQVATLSARFRIITMDLRGHGRTPAGDAPLTVARLAQDVTELVEHLNLSGAVGVGWSMGAQVLWRVLMGPARGRFDAMAIIDMTARVMSAPDWTLGLNGSNGGYDAASVEAAQAMMRADWPAYTRVLADRIVAQGSEDRQTNLIRWVEGQVSGNTPEPLAGLWGSLTAEDFRAALPGFDLPTLITHGAHSQLYHPDVGKDLAARLPGAQRVLFEHSGHALHLEEPERFNDALIQFVAALPHGDAMQTTRPSKAASNTGRPPK